VRVPRGPKADDDPALTSLQGGVQQAERVAEVAVPRRLRQARQRSAEPVRGVIVVHQHATAVGIVTPCVTPVEGAAADDEHEGCGQSTCEATITRRAHPHTFHCKRQPDRCQRQTSAEGVRPFWPESTDQRWWCGGVDGLRIGR
jgi:hypothetical protein